MNPLTNARTTEPVATNGAFASLGAALVPILIYAGVQSDTAGRYGSLAGAALAVIFAGWHLISARSKVMPTKGNAAAELLVEAKAVLAALEKLQQPVKLTFDKDASTSMHTKTVAGVVAVEGTPTLEEAP